MEFQVERYLDLTRSLARPAALSTHLRVQRWTLDEFAMPGQLFEDIIERLYRRDELHAGTLIISDAAVGPTRVNAPMVNVVDPRSHVIPPRSILPFHEAAGSRKKLLLHYRGDVGVALQHVAVRVGAEAHQQLWPQLLAWMHATWDQ
jgi:polyhydroxyalkanoate synthase